jgi:hypothetical protein
MRRGHSTTAAPDFDMCLLDDDIDCWIFDDLFRAFAQL